MPDHVHLFLSVPPYFSPHIIQRRIKARSARILRQEFPELLKLPFHVDSKLFRLNRK